MDPTDYSAWFDGKEFSTDWTSPNILAWEEVLHDRRDSISRVLEIGSWEGRSAIFFLNYLAGCTVTCIDTFGGSAECFVNPDWAKALPEIERRFDQNLAAFGSRVEKIKSTSHEGLGRLAIELRQFDLIFIDGSHSSGDVFADATLSWPMVQPGGIVIFDDYEWSLMSTELDRPKLGVNAFLAAHATEYRERYRGYQLIVQKELRKRGSFLRAYGR